MLPRLHSQTDVDPLVLIFLKELEQAGFTGDIESQYSSRLAVSTDNSVYQQLPQAVVHPRTTQDVALIGKLSNKENTSESRSHLAVAVLVLMGSP